jgi:hypothetical protein
MAADSRKILLLFISIAWAYCLHAQSNKHPEMDLSGQITDEYGNVLGWISKEGIVQNALDDRIAIIDKDGKAVDGRGQRIGKMKDGTFFDAYGSLVFTVREKKGQRCELVDPNGKIIGIVHPFYKNQASAIHCLYARLKMP